MSHNIYKLHKSISLAHCWSIQLGTGDKQRRSGPFPLRVVIPQSKDTALHVGVFGHQRCLYFHQLGFPV